MRDHLALFPTTSNLEAYLQSSATIDWHNDDIDQLAERLAASSNNVVDTVSRCFEWVRDEVEHSSDYRRNPSTCRASDVLHHRTGFCYAKSHLLAALLRANAIPTGLCYQRLSQDDVGPPFCLHGLNAVYISEYGWCRLDARGNKLGVNAQFTPPTEQLAYPIRLPGEADLPEIWPEPLPVVVDVLTTSKTYQDILDNLPDIELHGN